MAPGAGRRLCRQRRHHLEMQPNAHINGSLFSFLSKSESLTRVFHSGACYLPLLRSFSDLFQHRSDVPVDAHRSLFDLLRAVRIIHVDSCIGGVYVFLRVLPERIPDDDRDIEVNARQ